LKALLERLKLQLEGELHFDKMSITLYATDASVYRELPLAVAIPRHSNDIKNLVKFASDHKVSLIPRAAGTSLAGQCVGYGIVVDISKYMNSILEINTNENWVRVEPGVIRDELNLFLQPYGLFFGPNTSTANRATIGGMVGNNSSGSTSIVYGDTRQHVLELKTILSNGSEITFGDLTKDEFKQKLNKDDLEGQLYQQIYKELSQDTIQATIHDEFPKAAVIRRNTGYAVDTLLKTELFSNTSESFNFSKLLAGSEGTLAFTTEIKLNVSPLPKPKVIVVAAHFKSISESLKAAVLVMKHSPTACELMDKTILDCTKDNIEQQRNRFFVDGDPEAILIIEFRSDTHHEAHTQANDLIETLKTNDLGFTFPIISGNETDRVWNLRKAGLGLLANIPGDKKAVACIEDTAVAVEDLPEYINAFTALMKTYNQEAVYYAHAGAGELHLRPILNLKSSEDVKLFRQISEASARLVKQYRGSLSGEHGDGRVRAEFIPLVLGEANYQLLKRIKQTWDKHNIFNPGKIVNALPMDTHLRYETNVKTSDIETIFNYNETGGILKTVEKCNGSGDCRKLNFAGGTMCPSYRATLNEKDTTRGRANVLREFLTQNTKDNPFNHSEIKTAMDLCISCKGCKSECPSNVDMATLKAEFLYQYHQSNKVSLRDKVIANNSKLNAFGVKLPTLTNWISKQPWFKNSLGIAKERSLPKLQKQTLKSWFKKNENTLKSIQPKKKTVILFCDEYTNYYDVTVGKKTIQLLNKLGYHVKLVNHKESGRAYISKGFLKQAQDIAIANVDLFSDLISENIPLLGIEPSAILSFRDEYPNLVQKKNKTKALTLSKNVFLIDEFIAAEINKGNINESVFTTETKTIMLHGHCHQKALSSTSHTETLLSLPVNYSVNTINSGCCGMAGSFGYEKEHYELSQQIGEMVVFPEVNKAKASHIIAASGTSCRHQIKDGTRREAQHPIEILFDALL